jgi:hypothetical protein
VRNFLAPCNADLPHKELSIIIEKAPEPFPDPSSLAFPGFDRADTQESLMDVINSFDHGLEQVTYLDRQNDREFFSVTTTLFADKNQLP